MSRLPAPDPARRAVSFCWLVVVWLVLWRDVSWANLVSGVLVAAVVTMAFPVIGGHSAGMFRPVALARFVIFTAWSVVRANVIVAWEVVTPANRINEAVVAVPLASRRPGVIALVSHAISLAPGTIVIDVTEPEDPLAPTMLHIHVLHFRSIDEVRAEVVDLEERALAAFPAAALPAAPTMSTPTADDQEEAR